jgi:regulator of sigma E protease
LFLFVMITYVWGEEYIPAKNVKYGIYADSLGRKIGLQSGDKILAVDNKSVETMDIVPVDIVLKEAKTLQVERNGQQVNINIPDNFAKQLNKNKLQGFVYYRYPMIVDSITPKANFISGKLEKGDRVVGVNNQPIQWFHEYDSLRQPLKDKQITLNVLRGADTVNVTAKLTGTQVGFFQLFPDKLYGVETKKYGLIEAIPVGISRCWETLGRYMTGLKQIFTGKVAAKDSLGSVISIGNTFPGVWDWERFWTLTAIFSIILAFMNVLPIPALDGGHALFTLYEMITGRKPSDKFMEYAQMVGMILLLGLMAYALGLDFWRLFTK